MVNIPGWPSLTDVEKVPEQSPYPGSISDFDDCISKFSNLVEDARMQIRRNKDSEKMTKKEIRENTTYINQLNKTISSLEKKGKKIDSDLYANIKSAGEEIAEGRKVLGMLPAHRSEWKLELAIRQQNLTKFRQERQRGLYKNGEPRKCRSRNTADKAPCNNPMHYRKGAGWGPCPIAGH